MKEHRTGMAASHIILFIKHSGKSQTPGTEVGSVGSGRRDQRQRAFVAPRDILYLEWGVSVLCVETPQAVYT